MNTRRYVLRAGQFRWLHPLDNKAGDTDCTDMTDAEFEQIAAATEAAEFAEIDAADKRFPME